MDNFTVFVECLYPGERVTDDAWGPPVSIAVTGDDEVDAANLAIHLAGEHVMIRERPDGPLIRPRAVQLSGTLVEAVVPGCRDYDHDFR